MHSCGKANGTQFSGPEIHCPTIQSCTECNINCNDYQSCTGAVIFGHECTNLLINIGNQDNRNMTIYAPNNRGSLTIIISMNAGLEQSYIYSGNDTGNISINCQGYEFIDNEIHGSDINGILSFSTTGDCKADYSSVICPNDNQCTVNCTGDSCKSMIIQSLFGTHTLDFICSSTTNCTGTVLNCNYNSIGSTDCSMTGCYGPCVLPSYNLSLSGNIPTINPTLYPTIYYYTSFIPTYNPVSRPLTNSFMDIVTNDDGILYAFLFGISAAVVILVCSIISCILYKKYHNEKIVSNVYHSETNLNMDDATTSDFNEKPQKEQHQKQFSSVDIINQKFMRNLNFENENEEKLLLTENQVNDKPQLMPKTSEMQLYLASLKVSGLYFERMMSKMQSESVQKEKTDILLQVCKTEMNDEKSEDKILLSENIDEEIKSSDINFEKKERDELNNETAVKESPLETSDIELQILPEFDVNQNNIDFEHDTPKLQLQASNSIIKKEEDTITDDASDILFALPMNATETTKQDISTVLPMQTPDQELDISNKTKKTTKYGMLHALPIYTPEMKTEPSASSERFALPALFTTTKFPDIVLETGQKKKVDDGNEELTAIGKTHNEFVIALPADYETTGGELEEVQPQTPKVVESLVDVMTDIENVRLKIRIRSLSGNLSDCSGSTLNQIESPTVNESESNSTLNESESNSTLNETESDCEQLCVVK